MISGNSLKARGWAEGHLLGLAKRAGAARVAADADGDRERALDLLDDVRADQARYQGHAVLGDLWETWPWPCRRRRRRPSTFCERRAPAVRRVGSG